MILLTTSSKKSTVFVWIQWIMCNKVRLISLLRVSKKPLMGAKIGDAWFTSGINGETRLGTMAPNFIAPGLTIFLGHFFNLSPYAMVTFFSKKNPLYAIEKICKNEYRVVTLNTDWDTQLSLSMFTQQYTSCWKLRKWDLAHSFKVPSRFGRKSSMVEARNFHAVFSAVFGFFLF